MPIAPIAQISVVPPLADPGTTPREALRLSNEVLQPLDLFVAQKERALQSRMLTDATTALTRAMNDYESQADGMDPGQMLAGFEEMVAAEKERISSDILHGDGRLMDMFEVRTLAATENRHARLSVRQRNRLEDAEIAAIEAHAEEVMRSMAIDSSSAQEEWEAWESSVRASGLSAVKQGRVLRAGNHAVDMNAAAQVIERNPGAFLAGSKTPEAFFDHYPNLNEENRIPLRQKAEARKRRMISDVKVRNREAEDRAFDEMFGRVYDPENHPDGLPTISELRDSALPNSTKQTFANLINKINRGEDANFTDQRLVNELFARVNNPDHPLGHITDQRQLHQYFGGGMDRENYDKLKKDIEDNNSPVVKRVNTEKENLISAGVKQLDKSTLVTSDPGGSTRAYKFRHEFLRLWEDGIKRGVDPGQMLDPNHKESLGNVFQRFIPTARESIDAMTNLLKLGQPAENVPERQEGETIEQWEKRTGGGS